VAIFLQVGLSFRKKKKFEMSTLFGCYAAYTGNALPTIRDNIPVLSQNGKKSKQMQGWIR
jgi:hypothetical protein